MVKTNWGQEAPYNGKFYIDQNKIDMVQTANGVIRTSVPVGCVNVALAQLMGYTHLKVYKPLIFMYRVRLQVIHTCLIFIE